jgi:hypothetical protein
MFHFECGQCCGYFAAGAGCRPGAPGVVARAWRQQVTCMSAILCSFAALKELIASWVGAEQHLAALLFEIGLCPSGESRTLPSWLVPTTGGGAEPRRALDEQIRGISGADRGPARLPARAYPRGASRLLRKAHRRPVVGDGLRRLPCR